jgi:hypothetical protein
VDNNDIITDLHRTDLKESERDGDGEGRDRKITYSARNPFSLGKCIHSFSSLAGTTMEKDRIDWDWPRARTMGRDACMRVYDMLTDCCT